MSDPGSAPGSGGMARAVKSRRRQTLGQTALSYSTYTPLYPHEQTRNTTQACLGARSVLAQKMGTPAVTYSNTCSALWEPFVLMD